MKQTTKTKKEALRIVREYFGGYLPKTLLGEGMWCKDDAEIYALVEKIENYYMAEHPEADFSGREDEVHAVVTSIVKSLNEAE